jgi:hypothetical protein
MMDTRQKLTPPRPGSPTRANDTGHIIAAVKRMLIQGAGIYLRPMGDQIQINATISQIGPVNSGESATAPSTKGRITCPTVYSLPAIPTNGNTFQMVFWTSEDEPHDEGEDFQAGTGDDSVWWTRNTMSRWYPLTYSTLDGTPGDEELV